MRASARGMVKKSNECKAHTLHVPVSVYSPRFVWVKPISFLRQKIRVVFGQHESTLADVIEQRVRLVVEQRFRRCQKRPRPSTHPTARSFPRGKGCCPSLSLLLLLLLLLLLDDDDDDFDDETQSVFRYYKKRPFVTTKTTQRKSSLFSTKTRAQPQNAFVVIDTL